MLTRKLTHALSALALALAAHAADMPLKVEMPKPLFAGTPRARGRRECG